MNDDEKMVLIPLEMFKSLTYDRSLLMAVDAVCRTVDDYNCADAVKKVLGIEDKNDKR